MFELRKPRIALNNSKTIIPMLHHLTGEVHLPGSKSMTNRAMILSALYGDLVTIHNALISDDTLMMVNALKSLGFLVNVSAEASTISIQGCAGKIPSSTAKINVGNAGTVARFLTAMLCLYPGGTYYLDGSPAMRKRPIKELLDSLEVIGAVTVKYHQEIGHFPFTLNTHGLFGGEIAVDSSKSSQILSALLLIAPLSSQPLLIKQENEVVSEPFIEMTLQMMKEFGQEPKLLNNREFLFSKQLSYNRRSGSYLIESDFTAASYFFALTLIIGGQLKFPGFTSAHSLQGDIAFAHILETYGLKIEKSPASWNLKSSSVIQASQQELDFKAFSDTFLTLAAIAPLLKTSICIRGIAHTRFQESDRIAAVTNELRKLNQDIIESYDSITINPRPLRPAVIDTYGDHRIAMSFAILGSYDLFGDGSPWLSINDPSCCSKTFPNFFSTLDSLRETSVLKLRKI